MDAGWTSWLFEQYGFDFVTLEDGDIANGELRSRIDVLVLAEPGQSDIVQGFQDGEVPPRYSGGIGSSGVRAIDAFVREGGTLVCLNRSSDFAIKALGLPVRNVIADLDRKDFYASGSILEVEVDESHPVMAGMPLRAKVFFGGSPVFTRLEGFEGRAFAKYRTTGSPLLSGYLLGEKYLNGFAAAMEVAYGKGRVLLIGFRPQWRGQPFGTFRVLFNAVLFHGAIAQEGRGAHDFWIPPPAAHAEK